MQCLGVRFILSDDANWNEAGEAAMHPRQAEPAAYLTINGLKMRVKFPGNVHRSRALVAPARAGVG